MSTCKKTLPVLVHDMQFSVCTRNHVHLEMVDDNGNKTEIILDDVEDMLAFEAQVRRAIDAALEPYK